MPAAAKSRPLRPCPGPRDPVLRAAQQTTELEADNIEVFDIQGAARYLNCEVNTIEQATARNVLCPAQIGGRNYWTRRDLVRYQKSTRKELRQALIVERLRTGEHPVDVYLQLVEHGVSLDDVLRVTKTWAKLAGVWLVEAPPGSYARWLERLGRTRVTARDVRRCIEAMLAHGGKPDSWRSVLRPLETSEAGALSATCAPPRESSE